MSEDWQAIDSAPKDTELLVFSRPWGVIVASLSGEFGQWMSRMQVPVSIGEDDLPTHWRNLPEPPDGAGEAGEEAPAHRDRVPTA